MCLCVDRLEVLREIVDIWMGINSDGYVKWNSSVDESSMLSGILVR